MYVPTYNPTVVYGTWAYPAYPPYAYYPPSYSAGAAIVGFGVGMAVGAAWGHAWGGCNWNSGDVDIDVNRNVNINQSIDRSKYNQVSTGFWNAVHAVLAKQKPAKDALSELASSLERIKGPKW